MPVIPTIWKRTGWLRRWKQQPQITVAFTCDTTPMRDALRRLDKR